MIGQTLYVQQAGVAPTIPGWGVYAGLGDNDQAFAWLEKGFRDKTGSLDFVVMETSFDPIRSDPRYADLLHRIGLRP